jgi:chromosome segregation ATPase
MSNFKKTGTPSSKRSKKSNEKNNGSYENDDEEEVKSKYSVKTENGKPDYKKLVKKLLIERNKLKETIQELNVELEDKNKEYVDDLEKTQEYFEKQIDTLMEERNEAVQKVENLKSGLKKIEKEVLLQKEYYQKKIRKQKSIAVTELNNSGNLKENLENKQKEIENLRDEMKKLENKYKTQLGMYEAKMNDVKNERYIENEIFQVKREKDKEYKEILDKKEGEIFGLKNKIQNMEVRNKQEDKIRDEKIKKINDYSEYIKQEYENKFNEIGMRYSEALQNITKEYEQKLSIQEGKHNAYVAKLNEEFEIRLGKISSDNVKSLEIFRINADSELNKLTEKLIKLETDKKIEEQKIKEWNGSGMSKFSISDLRNMLDIKDGEINKLLKMIESLEKTNEEIKIVNEKLEKTNEEKDCEIQKLNEEKRKLNQEMKVNELSLIEIKDSLKRQSDKNIKFEKVLGFIKTFLKKSENDINNLFLIHEKLEEEKVILLQKLNRTNYEKNKMKSDLESKFNELFETCVKLRQEKEENSLTIHTLNKNIGIIKEELYKLKNINSKEIVENLKLEKERQIDLLLNKINTFPDKDVNIIVESNNQNGKCDFEDVEFCHPHMEQHY